MRRSLFAVALVVLALAGPANAAARPLAAEIIRAVLVVHLDDGRRCVALTPFTTSTGTFANCDGYGWRVTADARVNPLRRIVEGGFALVGAEEALHPMALIEVTAPAGRVFSFLSPEAPARR